ncbi:4-(cytidine 5'-diphospho)-2-C-methyl-D-erythritol kinase [Candidatus Pelagibacter sp.]|jgi:4-diphosphocytidyl-2-C-methyl-D-erythritol kinase|nr:4-(cytidine 5'-diphospho)-2-C-methyl-D-erythritol kinase [Candidatus Pelagibacter sp.]
MSYSKIKSYAKINLALNIIGKSSSLHKIESIISFLDLHDLILIKKITNKDHKIKFNGMFSKNIGRDNSVSRLLDNIHKKNLLKKMKFEIIIQKNIPSEAGLGGGSMNAAYILKFLLKKNIIKISKKQIIEIANSVGSDVILGMYSKKLVLKSNNTIQEFSNLRNFNTLVVKPNFGCSTKKIYSEVKNFKKAQFSRPSKNMFNFSFLKKTKNDLESIAFNKHPRLYNLKAYLEKLSNVKFVRMTGSGSAVIAYFSSNKFCKAAERKVRKQFRNYWCKTAKTI